MTNTDLVPVILCGGAGTRLWPLSRAEKPKQFHVLAGNHTLLQQTVLRTAQVTEAAPVIVTNAAHGALIREQMAEIGADSVCVIEEPCARNTAPAIGLAARYLQETRPGALMWVLPSDHIIGDVASLAVAARIAADAARAGYLTTFGIKPTMAHTGYGYIRSGNSVGDVAGASAVDAFLEKPDLPRAERFVADGGYYWNSGMFVFSAERILDELDRYAPEVLGPVGKAWDGGALSDGCLVPDEAAFASAEAISIDYAVMERTDRAVVVPMDADWSDIGSWSAIWDLQPKDADGNALLGPAFAHDSRNCYARTTKPVALIGVDDLVVVETDDAILVVRRDKSELVKKAATTAPWPEPEGAGKPDVAAVKASAA